MQQLSAAHAAATGEHVAVTESRGIDLTGAAACSYLPEVAHRKLRTCLDQQRGAP
jgi:hypothetical protein